MQKFELQYILESEFNKRNIGFEHVLNKNYYAHNKGLYFK